MSATSRRILPLPTGRGWWLVVAGIVAGLALFLMILAGDRDERLLQDADDARRPAAAAPVLRPLPVPPTLEAADDGAADVAEGAARLEEPVAPPPRPDALAGPPPPAATPEPVGPTSGPVPVESPGPRYPARALRRQESGQVLLRVEVDVRGMPARIDVTSSSGSRDLDRAALAAVRRWRFRPAMREGEPVDGVVNVPIDFDGSR